jgi:putative tricarboxylic transport membrane protein
MTNSRSVAASSSPVAAEPGTPSRGLATGAGPASAPPQARSGISEDVGAGLFLIALAGVSLWQGAGLDFGSLRQIGPGLLPRVLSLAVGACGALLVVRSRFLGKAAAPFPVSTNMAKPGMDSGHEVPGRRLARWAVRGPLCTLGAAVLFGLCVRPLGLAVAGPVAVLVSALASPETRWREVGVFAVLLTLFCIALFKWLLQLPIPLCPLWLGY